MIELNTIQFVAGTRSSENGCSRSEKWKKKAFTLFREVQSENKMLSLFFEKWKVKLKCFETEIEKWKFSRIPDNSRETRFYNRIILWKPKKTAQTDGLLQHFDILTIEKSESLFKGAASFLFADLTASQLFLLILASYLGNEKSES